MLRIQGVFTAINEKTKPIPENWAEDATYGCSLLLCNASYDVIIQARNVNGTSKEGQPLKIPKYNTGACILSSYKERILLLSDHLVQ